MGAVVVGSILDSRYQIIEMIGAGGLGRVFKAKDLQKDKIVAIKFLHDHLMSKPHLLGIFYRELLISSSFEHKNIVNVRGSHFDPPNCYIVTDFISGWNGYQFSKKNGKVPAMVALAICVDLLQGLDYLHLHDVVHSDLSISNVMINKEGRVLIADFGLSFDTEVENYENKQFGTPGYVSPEHITVNKLGPKSDLYCVGLILWQLVTGKKFLPPGKEKPAKILAAMKKRDLSELHINDPHLRRGLLKILKKSLSYSQFFRYKSAQHMLVDCYKLMLSYQVGYARNVIWQYLDDKGLTEVPFQRETQDIYSPT